MRTVTFNAIIETAAELTGRTADNLPLEEAAMLRGFLHTDLLDLWTAAPWPELIPDIEEIAVADRQFSKREGEANEMGMIVGVWKNNPQLTTRTRLLSFYEGDNKVRLDETITPVFVEYLLPFPALIGLSAAQFDAYEVPERFLPLLSYRAAAVLLDADQQLDTSNRMEARATRARQSQLENLVIPPYREGFRVRGSFTQTLSTATV